MPAMRLILRSGSDFRKQTDMTQMNARRIAEILRSTLFGLLAVGLAAATAAPVFGQAHGAWTYTGFLHTARQFHTATLLNNGQVLVIGGFFDGEATSLVDSYNPSTGEWTETGFLLTARFGHTATLLANGEVLVTGGFSTNNQAILNSAELYNPSTNTSRATGSMTLAREFHSAVLLPSGEVLVTGGFTPSGSTGDSRTNAAEIYNPATGTFTASGSMNDARADAQLTLLQNGKALIAGGGDGNDDASCTAELFSKGHWSLTSTLSLCGVSVDTTALLPNGDVLLDGGSNNQFYDPSTNAWQPTLGSADINVGPLALLADGKVLVAGVTTAGISAGPGSRAAALYDPTTNEWTPTGSLKQTLDGLTLTTLLNGQVLAAGGSAGSDSDINDRTELYTP
jgi:hypothetical protein